MHEPTKDDPSPQSSVLVILGPTAVGKSNVAIEVALSLGGEIISSDSRGFFQGVDIATDKPLLASRRGVVHHLIDVVGIRGSYNAMDYRNDVDRLIGEIRARGRLPVIAGGGTLYIGAITRGIFEGPSADDAIRTELLNRPITELRQELRRVDPITASKVHGNDRLRIVRALEVYRLTGKPISLLKREATPLAYHFRVFGLRRDRDDHRRAIEARVDRMLAAGLIAEVARLRDEGLCEKDQAYLTIGVREVFSFLDGELSEEELGEMLVKRTWELARRQMAWFRKEANVEWIDVTGFSAQNVAQRIVAHVEKEGCAG